MLWSAKCSLISEVWYKRRKVIWTIGIAALRRELLHVQRSSIFIVFMILSWFCTGKQRKKKVYRLLLPRMREHFRYASRAPPSRTGARNVKGGPFSGGTCFLTDCTISIRRARDICFQLYDLHKRGRVVGSLLMRSTACVCVCARACVHSGFVYECVRVCVCVRACVPRFVHVYTICGTSLYRPKERPELSVAFEFDPGHPFTTIWWH